MTDSPSQAELTRRLIQFRDDRDWRQFHSLKDLMLSLNLEAAELLELTQWRDAAEYEAAATGAEEKQRIAEECADIYLYLLLICERLHIDLNQAAAAKIDTNERKYPVEKSRGSARKYTQL